MIRIGTLAAILLSSASMVTIAGAAHAQDEDIELEAPEIIVVRGAFIPDEKRETSEIASVLDAEDFAVTGDADAASALLRVTGLSLNEGKFVIVRGLNERYSYATINGSPLPSPEPLRRAAPLDLFPTNALESVLVQKTYSPEYSGEFGGGVIDLRTRSLPNQAFLDVGFSIGYNTEITGEELPSHEGGDLDFTGWDDGTRNRPFGVAQGFFDGDAFPVDEADRVAAELADPDLVTLTDETIAPNYGFSISAGDRIDLDSGLGFGAALAVSFDNSWSRRQGRIQDPNQNGLSLESELNRDRVTNEITSSLLATLGVDYIDHEAQFTFLGARSTDKITDRQDSLSDPSFDEAGRERTEWFERQAWITQVSGESYFASLSELSVAWRASYSEALRDAPFQYEVTRNDGGVTIDSLNRVTWRFQLLNDEAQDYGVDLELPLYVGDIELVMQGGWAYRTSDRETIERQYFLAGSASAADRSLPVAELATLDGVFAQPFDNPNNVPESFVGDLEVNAFYLATDAQLGPFIRAQVGVRVEDVELTADAFSRNSSAIDQNPLPDSEITEDKVLPAVTLTWNPLENQQVRFGYSETYVLPAFRELAPQLFTDEDGNFFEGNPFLKQTEIENFDLRYEWYFGRSEFFTAGLFYKNLEDPIVQGDATSADSLITRFVNAPDATLQGLEIEIEKRWDLGDYFDAGFLGNKELIVAANYTYTDSEVGNDGEVLVPDNYTDTGIPEPRAIAADRFIRDGAVLQGQSENIFNLQLGWEDFEAQSQLRLLLNFVDDRVFSYGSLDGSRLETFDEASLGLDLRYSRTFQVLDRDVDLSVSWRNIDYTSIFGGEDYYLNRRSRATIRDDVLVQEYNAGQSISVGVTGKF